MPKGIKYAPFDFVGNTDFGLGMHSIMPLQSKDEFMKRTLATSVAMNFYPPTRDRLYELLQEGSWNHFTHITTAENNRKISWQEMTSSLFSSKIGFAPDGATGKTERHIFVPFFTAMMMHQDNIEFPFEWIDGINCLKMEHDFINDSSDENHHNQNGHDLRVLNKERTKEKILLWLSQPEELYKVYKEGYANAQNYRLPNYFRDHIGRTIKENL